MFGIVISDPGHSAEKRRQWSTRLEELMIPAFSFTDEQAAAFDGVPDALLVRRACEAVWRPDTPIPAERLMAALRTGDPRPANALRRAVSLQLSLLPTIRADGTSESIAGAHRLGSRLMVPHADELGRADCALPDGRWTVISTGAVCRGRFRDILQVTEFPVLAAPNALIAARTNDRSVSGDEADRLTLHWYEPDTHAQLTLADGTEYRVSCEGERYTCEKGSAKPWRLIVHADGEERLLC